VVPSPPRRPAKTVRPPRRALCTASAPRQWIALTVPFSAAGSVSSCGCPAGVLLACNCRAVDARDGVRAGHRVGGEARVGPFGPVAADGGAGALTSVTAVGPCGARNAQRCRGMVRLRWAGFARGRSLADGHSGGSCPGWDSAGHGLRWFGAWPYGCQRFWPAWRPGSVARRAGAGESAASEQRRHSSRPSGSWIQPMPLSRAHSPRQR
jgi:hypothetical protein